MDQATLLPDQGSAEVLDSHITLPELFNTITFDMTREAVQSSQPLFAYTDAIACPDLDEVTCGFIRDSSTGRVKTLLL